MSDKKAKPTIAGESPNNGSLATLISFASVDTIDEIPGNVNTDEISSADGKVPYKRMVVRLDIGEDCAQDGQESMQRDKKDHELIQALQLQKKRQLISRIDMMLCFLTWKTQSRFDKTLTECIKVHIEATLTKPSNNGENES